MKKKLIGLSILLLVLLLGLSTTSYAYNYTVTNEDCDKIAEYVHQGNTNLPGKLYWLKNRVYQDYDTFAMYYTFRNNSRTIQVYGFNSDNVDSVSNLNSENYMTITFKTLDYYGASLSSSNWNNHTYNGNSNLTISMGSGGQLSTQYVLYSNDLGNIATGPWQSRNVLTFAIPFGFVPAYSDTIADVWTFEDVPFYNVGSGDLYIGQLFVPFDSNSKLTNRSNFYYKYNIWNYRELNSDSIYSSYLITDRNVACYDIYVQRKYLYENTLYSITWTDSSTSPYTLATANFYIKNIYTNIINGVLDTSTTFSGDYNDLYDNQQDNIQDVENIREAVGDIILDDSEVDSMLSNFDTSGEIIDIFGYHVYTDDSNTPYYNPNLFITSVIDEFIDELMRSGDRYFDVSLHGERPTRIYARFFTTPEDNPLIMFVRWALIFGSIYCIYKNLYLVGESISTLNIHSALNQLDVDRFIYRM